MPDYQGVERLNLLPRKAKVQSLLNSKNAYGAHYILRDFPVCKSKVEFPAWNPFDARCPIDIDHMPSQKQNLDSAPRQMKVDCARQSASNTDISVKKSSHVKTFAVGTYVMAAWRNDFEYLAEVLAHRQRQGNKSEYRLRYVWDHVVEWTSVGRLRKATQYEIDYVLKFCKEHTFSAPDKACRLEVPDPSTTTDADTLCIRPKRMRLSSEVISDEARQIVKPESRSRSSRSVSSLPEDKKPACPVSLLDSKAEQDGMLYDKSVIQFHEACRKRRELKRQAIEAEQKSGGPQHVSELNSQKDTVQKKEVVERSLSESSPVLSEKALISNPVAASPPLMNSETLELNSNDIAPTFNQSKQPLAKSTSKAHLHSERLLDRTTCQEKGTISQSVDPLKVSKSENPTVFPCPFCPRKLRNSKLLNVHVRNYHKDISAKSTNHNANTKEIKPVLSESVNLPLFSKESSSIPGTESAITSLLPGAQKSNLLVCHRCNSRSYVDDNHDLIQCNSCFYWIHRSCYNIPVSKSSKEDARNAIALSNFSPLLAVCDGCRSNLRPRRKSRSSDWQYSIYQQTLRSEHASEIVSAPNDPYKLLTKVSVIFDKASHLHPLLRSGWNSLKKMNLQTAATPNKQGSSRIATIDPTCTNAITQQTKIKSDTNESVSDVKTSEDQVNRLYMELRGIAFGNLHETTPVKGANQSSQNDMNLFSVNTSDSDCSTNCWQIYETAESVAGAYNPEVLTNQAGENSYTSGNQELSGFFQDLGPDIIPEISGFNYDGTLDEANVNATPAVIDEFFKVPKSLNTSQPSTPQRIKRLLNGDNLGLLTSAKDRPLSDAVTQTLQDKAPLTSLMDTGKLLPELSGTSVSEVPTHSDAFSYEPDINLKVANTNPESKVNNEFSADLLEQQPNSTAMINLPLPACARSIMSDLLKGSLCDEFAVQNSNIRHAPKISTSVGVLSTDTSDDCNISSNYGFCNLDMEWFDASSNSRANQSTSDTTCHPPTERRDHVNVTGLSDDVMKLTQSQSELSFLDNHLLTPLEGMLTHLESQLNSLGAQVKDLEKKRIEHNPCPKNSCSHNIWHSPSLDLQYNMKSSSKSTSAQSTLVDNSFQMYKTITKTPQLVYQTITTTKQEDVENCLTNSKVDVHRFFHLNISDPTHRSTTSQSVIKGDAPFVRTHSSLPI